MTRWALLPAVVLAAKGCARPAIEFLTPPAEPVVWPKPPDSPRIRFLGEVHSSADVQTRKSSAQFWSEVLYGPTPAWRLVSPHAVAVDAPGERVAVADTNGRCVHVFDLAARQYRRAEGFAAGDAGFACPAGVAWCGETLYVADAGRGLVAIIPPGGVGRAFGQGVLQRPAGIAYCTANDRLYVVDAAAHVMIVFDRDGRETMRIGKHGTEPGQFNYPTHVACGPDEIAVTDSLNFRVQRFALDGTYRGFIGRKGDAAGDLALPKGVAYDAAGRLWIVDTQFENVQAFAPDGQLLLAFGREGHGPGEFWLPAGVCVDAKRRVWIADTYNRRVQAFELLP